MKGISGLSMVFVEIFAFLGEVFTLIAVPAWALVLVPAAAIDWLRDALDDMGRAY